jgi:iron complex transport system substrate-binding protein
MRHTLLLATLLASTSAPVLAQDFPVTVEHIFGETTIETKPQRVVSVGFHEQDFLYALDVAPVGVFNWWGEHPYATWPWADAKREEVGAAPEVMPEGDGVNLEWVLAQDPDLIVAIYRSIDEDLYEELSKIAPVVASPAGYPLWGAPWREELRIIDEATNGSTDKAEAIIADIDARFEAAREAYPQMAGATGSNYYYYDGEFVVWGSNDAATRFLTDLGLVMPPELDALADDENRIGLSPEQVRLLDTDVAIWPLDPADGTQELVEAMPLYQNLDLAKEGRSIWLDDGEGLAYAAMSFQTPLSLGYLINTLPPLIAAAVDGDPATEVPSLKD